MGIRFKNQCADGLFSQWLFETKNKPNLFQKDAILGFYGLPFGAALPYDLITVHHSKAARTGRRIRFGITTGTYTYEPSQNLYVGTLTENSLVIYIQASRIHVFDEEPKPDLATQ